MQITDQINFLPGEYLHYRAPSIYYIYITTVVQSLMKNGDN